ncbi:MAG: hypothetical protein BWY83_01959 [bacterium ADurb.Bin478]|nr:MAG: hypothetical protein BWY83_01959 [bacterium ADurb.Bin478]
MQLILQRKTHHIEIAQGRKRLEGKKRNPLLAHVPFHVGPWGEHAFSIHTRHPVEQMIKNRKSEVGHADFIDIGKDQGETNSTFVRIFPQDIHLVADVATRFVDKRQKVVKNLLSQ